MDALIALFEQEGYARVEPPVLQPASVFTELSGEDIRRRMFVTQNQSGAELCLRPEYTIPVCRQHLEEADKAVAAYSYLGPVFRFRSGESGEFLQAGVESIGRDDKPAADAEIIGLALAGLEVLEVGPCSVMLGDMTLLNAVLDALALPPAGKRRVMRAIVSGRRLEGFENGESQGVDEHAGLLAAIEGQAPQAAKAFVEDVLAIAGIASVGGRSAGEIAERFLARASNRTGLTPQARAVLQDYLAIAAEPDDAIDAIRALAKTAQLDLGNTLEDLEARVGFIAASQADLSSFTFSTCFARNLDYYTGFIFEIHRKASQPGAAKPLVGGGRYDTLLRHLGAKAPLPAVGCAFWLDRIVTETAE